MDSRVDRADELLVQTFARIDAVALGISCGIVGGFGLLAATVILLIKGGPVVGPNLGLLGQYFPGYSVSWAGSVVGMIYGFIAAFAAGWMLAFVRNLSMIIYAHGARLWANLSSNHFLDRFDS